MAELRDARLLLIPGLVADPRLLEPQRRAFGEVLVPLEWIEPRNAREPLKDYAARWVERLRPRWESEFAGRPVFLGGVSLGGMCALEMARELETAGVFLIGSLRSHADVPIRTQLLDKLGRAVPNIIGRKLRSVLVYPYAMREGLDDVNLKLVREVAKEASIEMVRWGGHATVGWDFDGDFTPEQRPVFHIHGRDDWFFPLGDMQPDEVVPDGKHLINLTHPLTVNRFLRERMLAVLEGWSRRGGEGAEVAEAARGWGG